MIPDETAVLIIAILASICLSIYGYLIYKLRRDFEL